MAGLAPVVDPEVTCPVCWSGEAIRQTSRTPLVEAFSCDRCDTRWAISVVNPRPFLDGIATAVAVRSIADGIITLAPDRRAKAARNDDSEPRGYFIGECGHRTPLVGEGF
ncbi:MAG: hypothetical protein ACRDTA_11085 [Pseudonocardiaceae bacterium]